MLFLGRMVMDFVTCPPCCINWVHASVYRCYVHSSSKLMRLPLPFFDNRHAGDNMQRIADNQSVEDFFTSVFVTFVMAVVTDTSAG